MKKNFLLFTQTILGLILVVFTIFLTMDYNKNLVIGYFISLSVLVIYFFVLKKSFQLFSYNSIGAAYFLTISTFIVLLFIEMINCSNSMNWMH